jgi:ribonuclease HI
MLEIYTDGASLRGAGAWAWVACSRDSNGEIHQLTTHTMLVPEGHSLAMEMLAVIDAMRYARFVVDHPCLIVCDCAYVVNSLLHGWPQHWRSEGWRNAKGKPSAHQPLWAELLDTLEGTSVEIKFKYVRGHGRGDNLSNGPYRLGNSWADAACRGRINEFLRGQGNTITESKTAPQTRITP